jgi:hypothetical protein
LAAEAKEILGIPAEEMVAFFVFVSDTEIYVRVAIAALPIEILLRHCGLLLL